MIDKEEFKKLVLEGYTVAELQLYYNISRSSVYKYKKELDLVGKSPNAKKLDTEDLNSLKTCTTCKVEYPLSNFYSNGYSPSGKRKYKGQCKTCNNQSNYANKQNKINSVLDELNVDYSCTKCGYNKNTAALCFHHLDPNKKEFSISHMTEYKGADRDILLKEISKCIVLCHNCHMEEHYPHLNK